MPMHMHGMQNFVHREIYMTGIPGAVITGGVVTGGVVTGGTCIVTGVVVTGGVVGGGGVRMTFGGQVELLILKVTSARCTQSES